VAITEWRPSRDPGGKLDGGTWAMGDGQWVNKGDGPLLPVAHCCLSDLFFLLAASDVYVYVWGGRTGLDGCGGLYVFVITSVLCKYFQLFASFLLLFPHTHTPEHQDTAHMLAFPAL